MSTLLQRHRVAVFTSASAALSLTLYTLYQTRTCPLLTAETPTPSPPKAFSWPVNFLSLPLESSESLSHDTKRLRFAFPDPTAVSGLKPTSAVLLITRQPNAWLPTIRPYTPISSATSTQGHLDFAIKRYPHGASSTTLQSLAPGQHVLIVGPLPGYRWPSPPSPAPQNILLLAGGAGITPCYQLLRHVLLDAGEAPPKVTLVWGANAEEDVFLKSELEELERRFPDRFRVVVTLSRPGETWRGRRGYVDRGLLEEVLRLRGGERVEKVFVCGPPGMEDMLAGKGGVLAQMGWGKGEVVRF